MEYLIKKVIAYEGYREIVASDETEMHQFIEERIRPCFDVNDVLAVKFLYCICEEDENPEETVWYVNPCHCTNPDFAGYSTYGPRMDENFLPELLLVKHPARDVFEEFDSFQHYLLKENLSFTDKELLALFLNNLNSTAD